MQAQAFALLDRDRLTQVAAYLATHATEDETALQWTQLARMALRFKRQLRPLLLAVEIAATRRDSPLMEAVAFLRQAFTTDRPLRQSATAPFPSRCIPVRLKRYVYTEDAAGAKRLIPDRYFEGLCKKPSWMALQRHPDPLNGYRTWSRLWDQL